MAKATPDAVLDNFLNYIQAGVNITVTSSEPANYAAISAATLATTTLSSNWGLIANGDSSGRKLTVPQQTDVSISSSGTATHVCIDDGSALLYVTTCTSQALTSGGTVTVPTWDIEIADPT